MCLCNLFLNVLRELCFQMSCCDPCDLNRSSGFGAMPNTNLSQSERGNE